MKYPRNEQETIIRKYADEDVWHVYTSDYVLMNKLDKLVEASPEWKETNRTTCEGDICSKDYECSGNLISFRERTKKMTEEQKQKNILNFRKK